MKTPQVAPMAGMTVLGMKPPTPTTDAKPTLPTRLDATFHADGGHGWLEVDKKIVRDLNIKVSTFSYQKDDKAYLEEDCDATRFLKAAESAGIELNVIEAEHVNHSEIRNYPEYCA